MRARAAVLFLAIVFGADTALAFDADTVRTWQRAWIIPQPGWLMRMDEPRAQEWLASLSAPRPVYLFFHGSAGFLRVTDVKRYGYLTRAGFIVIAPDSFARAGRQSGRTERYIRSRHEEMAYALERLGAAPWADKDRVVVAGQSQGAIALAGFTAGGYRAAILHGFNCKTFQTTIRIPRAIPVLSLQDPLDPLYLNANWGSGTCAEALRGRAGSYVVEVPGGGHNVFDKPDQTKAPEAVVRFLRDNGLVVEPLPKSAMPRLRSPDDPPL